MNHTYHWSGGEEFLLQVCPEAPIQIILISPLFEEANRLRKTLVDVMHGLKARGFGITLPDFPATGESIVPLSNTTLDDWKAAVAVLVSQHRSAGRVVILASFRGGALIDSDAQADGVWRLAQETGARLMRDMRRMVTARPSATNTSSGLESMGYALPPLFVDALENALPQPVMKLRSVRLQNDSNEADARIAGAPLWRRSEPGEDAELVAAIIDDIADWATLCAKS